MVRSETLRAVAQAVHSLGKQHFRSAELVSRVRCSRRQLQRALRLLPYVKCHGSKRGAYWELLAADSVAIAPPQEAGHGQPPEEAKEPAQKG